MKIGKDFVILNIERTSDWFVEHDFVQHPSQYLFASLQTNTHAQARHMHAPLTWMHTHVHEHIDTDTHTHTHTHTHMDTL